MELEVYNIQGEKTSKKVVLNDSIFNIEPNDHAIYLDTRQYLANQRQGTASSKEKSMLTGSTRKLKKQKGTGSARFGSIKSPLFRGGARIFGPQPRDYSFKLNKKLKRLARKSALAYKARENQIVVIEDFSFDTPKTKSFVEILGHFELNDKKTLLVINQVDPNIILSIRNLEKARVLRAVDLSTYDILNASKLLFMESSIKSVEDILG